MSKWECGYTARFLNCCNCTHFKNACSQEINSTKQISKSLNPLDHTGLKGTTARSFSQTHQQTNCIPFKASPSNVRHNESNQVVK